MQIFETDIPRALLLIISQEDKLVLEALVNNYLPHIFENFNL